MHRCPECSTALPLRELACSGCGRELASPTTTRDAEALASSLSAELDRAPYARGASRLGYVLRSQVRGALDDPRHPLPRRLGHFLRELDGLAGERELADRLLAHCLHAGLRDAHPWVVDALELVRRRQAQDGQSM